MCIVLEWEGVHIYYFNQLLEAVHDSTVGQELGIRNQTKRTRQQQNIIFKTLLLKLAFTVPVLLYISMI